MDFTALLSGDFIVLYPSFLFIAKIYTISAIHPIYYFKYEEIYYPGTYNFAFTFFSSIPLQCY